MQAGRAWAPLGQHRLPSPKMHTVQWVTVLFWGALQEPGQCILSPTPHPHSLAQALS